MAQYLLITRFFRRKTKIKGWSLTFYSYDPEKVIFNISSNELLSIYLKDFNLLFHLGNLIILTLWQINIVITWQIKNVISPLLQDLWIPNVAVWWLRIREPHHQVSWHIDHVVRWKIKSVISPLSQGPWPPKLGKVLAQVKGANLKRHVTLRSCSHMTIQKRHISSTAGPMAPKLSRMLVILWLLR